MPERRRTGMTVLFGAFILGALFADPAAASAGSEAATSGGSGFGGTAAILASTVALALFARRR